MIVVVIAERFRRTAVSYWKRLLVAYQDGKCKTINMRDKTIG